MYHLSLHDIDLSIVEISRCIFDVKIFGNDDEPKGDYFHHITTGRCLRLLSFDNTSPIS